MVDQAANRGGRSGNRISWLLRSHHFGGGRGSKGSVPVQSSVNLGGQPKGFGVSQRLPTSALMSKRAVGFVRRWINCAVFSSGCRGSTALPSMAELNA